MEVAFGVPAVIPCLPDVEVTYQVQEEKWSDLVCGEQVTHEGAVHVLQVNKLFKDTNPCTVAYIP